MCPPYRGTTRCFEPLGSKLGGLALQLKFSSPKKSISSDCYAFGGTRGYDGMLLVLIALEHDTIWMDPGSEVSQTGLWITLGSQGDQAWCEGQVGPALKEFPSTQTLRAHKDSIPHISLRDALLQCSSRNHMVEEHSHTQLVTVVESVGLRLDRPFNLTCAVDSTLSCDGRQWRFRRRQCIDRELENILVQT
ncbi:unnamed protein product [Symbiodinium sp. CCMP2456]|nr:unnamed protein product [Symbiodinium sp. CCMP2456]